jgi:NitT/TauT family transport system substrate-binding protein
VIRIRLLLTVLLSALLVGACTGGSGGTPPPASAAPTTAAASSPPPPGASADPSVEPSVEPIKLTVGLGYIPSVQFAQFYLAQQAGYYREAGLEVEFQNRIDPDLIALVGQGALDVGIADGTSVIPAVSQGIPIKYVATIYGKFPSIVFAKESAGIADAADLTGRKIGIPGRYGSSWVMLQALLGSAGLTPEDVQVVEYPDFGQGAAVAQGAVDAATGFANNEPIQLERRCRARASSPGRRRWSRRATPWRPSSRRRCERWRRSPSRRSVASRPPSRRCPSSPRTAKARRRSSTRRSTRGRARSARPAAWVSSM